MASTGPLAAYKDLCIDAVDPRALAAFWAGVLHLDVDPRDEDGGKLLGPTPAHTVWVNRVPEPVTVKQRVHLDVRADSPADLERLGATVVDADSFPWTLMRDPEGGELCAFGVREGQRPGLMEIVVDTADPAAISTWWAEILGAACHHDEEHDFSYLEDIPGAPFEHWVFVPVPEPKTVKNRIHWDLTAPDIDVLLAAGATLLRGPGGDIDWHVLADPDGNEFCVFPPRAPETGRP